MNRHDVDSSIDHHSAATTEGGTMLAKLIPVRWWTTRCHGCSDTSAHDSHLTRFGRWALGLR